MDLPPGVDSGLQVPIIGWIDADYLHRIALDSWSRVGEVDTVGCGSMQWQNEGKRAAFVLSIGNKVQTTLHHIVYNSLVEEIRYRPLYTTYIVQGDDLPGNPQAQPRATYDRSRMYEWR